ncbi:MAG: hypothetical protein AB7J35_09995 [Dehalococcoidia bacterium]
MTQLKYLRPGMSLRDINQRPVGTVRAVLPTSYVAKINEAELELRRESLFSVGPFSATLVCEADAIERYMIREAGKREAGDG